MKIITWNVNGLRAVHRKGQFQRILEEDPDILCIQETKSLPNQLPDEARNPPGYHPFFHFPAVKKGYSGVAIYSKEKPLRVQNDLGIPEMDQEGRLILAEFPLPRAPLGIPRAPLGKDIDEQETFFLINCYFPNGGGAPARLHYKLDFYDHFLTYVERLKKTNKNIIFCGDVNVAHKEIDLARPKENSTHVGFLPIERAWMDKLTSGPAKSGVNWVDAFRHFYPDKVGVYTYWDMKSFARERNVGWRIDYFFTTPEMLKRVKKVEILDNILGSDHCPVELTLN